jgi:hypothetical protein
MKRLYKNINKMIIDGEVFIPGTRVEILVQKVNEAKIMCMYFQKIESIDKAIYSCDSLTFMNNFILSYPRIDL